ncbi:hypothetical protein ABEF95_001500 [Exophiala dermatitidis]
MVYGRLCRLDNAGIRLDDDSGRLVDWADQPPTAPPPYGDPVGKEHREFGQRDDGRLREWLKATFDAGITGARVFDELSALLPNHSPSALASRARRLAQSDATSPPETRDRFQEPFVNLDAREPAGSQSPSPANSPTTGGLPAGLTYSDFRMDIERSVTSLLALENGDTLEDLLQRPWLAVAFQEYSAGSPDDLFAAATSSDDVLRGMQHQAQHVEKVIQAENAITSNSARYLGDVVDKTAWTVTDYQVRFIVRVAVEVANGGDWPDVLGTSNQWKVLCQRAFWLLNWLRFIHKAGNGKGKESIRLARKKQEWLSLLQVSLQRLVNCRHRTRWPESEAGDDAGNVDMEIWRTRSAQPPADVEEEGEEHRYKTAAVASLSDGESVVQTPTPPLAPAGATNRTDDTPIPKYRMPLSRDKDQQKGVSWLTQHMRTIFTNNLRRRLNA